MSNEKNILLERCGWEWDRKYFPTSVVTVATEKTLIDHSQGQTTFATALAFI